jgi:hypothetical protein
VNLRVVVGWLERRLRSAWTADPVDLDDWLAGRDDAIEQRASERKAAAIEVAGGEVG